MKHDELRMGFLTAIEVRDHGFVGGLLVTNRFGRPLEFQCTTPVKPNRTQQILYGPTLVPFVLGELIGRTLIDKVSIKPHFILTENGDMLEVRNYVSIPVACLTEDGQAAAPDAAALTAMCEQLASPTPDASAPTPTTDAVAEPAAGSVSLNVLRLGRQKLRFHCDHRADSSVIESNLHLISRDADLHEPFERVREALNETVRPGTAR